MQLEQSLWGQVVGNWGQETRFGLNYYGNQYRTILSGSRAVNVAYLRFNCKRQRKWRHNLYMSRSYLKDRQGFYTWKCFLAPRPERSVIRVLLQGKKDKEMILYMRQWVQFETYLIWGALETSGLKPLVRSWDYEPRAREV